MRYFPVSEKPDEPEDEETPLMRSGSATDCTGLIPSAALSESEIDSYEQLYDFLPPFIPGAGSDSIT